MKKILITGLTGFVGSWLAILLISKKYKVYGISLVNKKPMHIYNKANLSKYCKSYICDIRDYNKVYKIFQKVRPDMVVHLAAQSLVIESYAKPFDTLFTNIIGTLNILKLTNMFGSGKVINFTSDKVYENKIKNDPFKENDNLKGFDPYSLSKSCSDLIGQCLNMKYNKKSNKLQISTLRCGNLIGGGDWSKDRLITDYYLSYIKNKTLTIRNPSSIRPWQHVINSINIIYQIINKKNIKFFDSFNIGPNKSDFSVKFVINLINDLNNKKVKIKYTRLYNLKETNILKLNNAKSKFFFNYPKSNIKKDLCITNEWYLESFNNNKMIDFTLKQIHDYL